MNRSGRLTVVAARYGGAVIGGAEKVLARIAHDQSQRGAQVTVLTTTATDHLTGRSEQAAGTEKDGAVTVQRFPARLLDQKVRRALSLSLATGEPSWSDETRWVNSDLRSPELFHHLLQHVDEADAVLMGPISTWTTIAAAQLAGSKARLWTCLHDEPLARFRLIEPVLASATLMLQTDPEHELAHAVMPRIGRHSVVGCPVDIPAGYQRERFRQKFGIEGPFIVYAGRREGAKGWNELLRAFTYAVTERNLSLRLVTFGSGAVVPPAGLEDRIIDLGPIEDQDRDDALAAASACIQPSRLEAFSLTVMEAWLAGTLVIANREGAVVRWHCERSGSGLLYGNDAELAECLSLVAQDPEAADRMAAGGRSYVLDNYEATDVLDRIDEVLWSEGR